MPLVLRKPVTLDTSTLCFGREAGSQNIFPRVMFLRRYLQVSFCGLHGVADAKRKFKGVDLPVRFRCPVFWECVVDKHPNVPSAFGVPRWLLPSGPLI